MVIYEGCNRPLTTGPTEYMVTNAFLLELYSFFKLDYI